MTFSESFFSGTDVDEISKSFLHNAASGGDRFHSPYQYTAQNPYQTYEHTSNYYPYQNNPSYGGTAQATFDHPHIYSTIHGGGGGHHKSKNQSASLSALTLLAFLFFLHILTSCLKEQMTSMNPTVMVMTPGTGRIKKFGSFVGAIRDSNKESIDPIENSGLVTAIPISGNVDFLTNDHGDRFYDPEKQTAISSKLNNFFEARNINVNDSLSDSN